MNSPFHQFLRFLLPWLYARSTKTVRFAFPLFFTFITLIGASTLLTNKTTEIIIESNAEKVTAGEQFYVDVFVSATVPVNAVDISLHLPSGQMKVLGIDTGKSVITLWTEKPSFKNGTVKMSGGTFRKGFIGKHRIATIRVEAVTSGWAHIGVPSASLYAGDGSGSPVAIKNLNNYSHSLFILNQDGTAPQNLLLEGSAEVHIVGDLDGDGKVTLKDISMFMSAWRNKDVLYDLTGDGKMTFRDFSVILARFFIQ